MGKTGQVAMSEFAEISENQTRELKEPAPPSHAFGEDHGKAGRRKSHLVRPMA